MGNIITRKEAIALLAFITMVKEARCNSILFKKPAYKMAKDIGLSDGRMVKKYIAQCIRIGLCSELSKSYKNNKVSGYKFISYKNALQILLCITKTQSKYFPLHRKLGKFKEYQYRIELDIAGQNFSQQAFKLNANYPNKIKIMKDLNELLKETVSGGISKAKKSKRTRLLKKYTNADEQIKCSRIRNHVDGIVTGCNHLAKLIGKSHTTANKRFKNWEKARIISIQRVVEIKKVDSPQAAILEIDSLKASKKGAITIYCPNRGCIKTIYGKKVLGFKAGRCEVGCIDSLLQDRQKLSTNVHDTVVKHFPKPICMRLIAA